MDHNNMNNIINNAIIIGTLINFTLVNTLIYSIKCLKWYGIKLIIICLN